MPKSSNLTSPLRVTRMWAGVMSRCRTSLWCACWTAAHGSE
jgi:hypothetical protein